MSRSRSAFSRRQFTAASALALAPFSGQRTMARLQATPAPDSSSWDAITEQIDAVAPTSSFLASEIQDSAISPIASHNPDQLQAVGSSFKLYILATIGAQVREGALSWNQAVEIQDQYRSVPGGDLRYAFEGTELTLRYIAERMIQKSDNTATDHAIGVVGREAVEQMFTTANHSSPERNIPLLTTREFAFLKFAYPDPDAYLSADTATRRQILAEEIPLLDYEDLLATAEQQTAPMHIDTLEWFASPTDLTNVMLTLHTMATSEFALQPLLEIMALETQLELDGETWPYAGFKGGSEMGVLHGTWLLRRHDRRWFVLSMGFNDTRQALDMPAAIAAMSAAMDTLAAVP